MNVSLILLSAGKGIRIGNTVPKQYLLLAGKPMIVHTLERVDMIDSISEIIVVCNEEFIGLIENYIEKYKISKKIVFVTGGRTRQESVYNGLLVASNESIILHEAARPFVSCEDFEKLIECPEENVTYTYSIPYTVLKKNKDNEISDILNREELVNIQLPQKFEKTELLNCHVKAKQEERVFTEDAGLLKHYSNKVISCLPGKSYNIKITEYIDLLFGETLYKEVFLEETLQ